MLQRRVFLRELAAAGLFGSLCRPTQALAASNEDAILAAIDPELRAIARGILKQEPGPLTVYSLARYRSGDPPSPLAEIPFERRIISGRPGQPDVVIYVVNARPEAGRPGILHTHGGGFVLGSAAGAVPDLQKLCRELDCVAVSVEYRLAPETTYAGSIEDNYAGLRWLHANAASLGVDPGRVALLGESAGGGHAALLAIAARDRGEVPVCFQCLVYPMLDDRTATSRSVPPEVGHVIWDRQKNRFGWTSFLGRPAGEGRDPSGVPARATDLAGLPPGWIGVGSADLFVDEDIEYARRLNDAGVLTELLVVPGGYHAFDGSGTPLARRFTEAKISALRRALRAQA